jgi:hypothetical protein
VALDEDNRTLTSSVARFANSTFENSFEACNTANQSYLWLRKISDMHLHLHLHSNITLIISIVPLLFAYIIPKIPLHFQEVPSLLVKFIVYKIVPHLGALYS